MKAVEAAIDIKDEKLKAEVPVDRKGEKDNAEVPANTKEEKIKTEAPTDFKKEILKSEVVPVDAKGNDKKAEEVAVDINENEMKAEKVAVDAKEGEMKAEVPVNAEEEKMKAENVPLDTKEDKMKAAALAPSKEELMKTETPVDPCKAAAKVEVILVDANGEEVKEKDVKAYILQQKMKVEVLADIKEKQMKPEEVMQTMRSVTFERPSLFSSRSRGPWLALPASINSTESAPTCTFEASRVDVTMGLHELILEAIEELGDPDELVNNEDLIILKLEQACTNKRIPPEDIELSGDARRLSMCQRAFVSHRAFLGNLRYAAALFAGCSEFLSSKAFLETAKYVLKNVRSLVIVHNRNKILNLVNWFPTVTTIVLYHNLRLHCEKGVITSSLTLSRMEQLLGTMPALGLDHLSLSKATLQSLFNKCPKLASVMSSDMETALSAKKVVKVLPKRLPAPIRRKELFLGRTCIHYTGIPIELTAKSAVAVEKAHKHFPEAEHLELTAASESAIAKVASYTNVTHLSLFSALPKDKIPFEPHVTQVLSVLQLVHLSLTHFCGVKLSVIAKLCPQLKFLGIRVCGVDDEGDTAANFSSLEHLRVGSEMKEESFFKLLRSCPDLRELEIDKDELTTAFVAGPDESCWERPKLEHVERLTLRTNTDWFDICSLDYVVDLPSALDSTLSSLPSLRRVRTDHYDVRLHINSCFPNIALDWCMCTLCVSEFPKMNEQQRDIYDCTQYLIVPRPIEYVDIKGADNNDAESGERMSYGH
ncbi:hypothetical protein MTO96_025305 [Rhipicephalus appendiculatus]